MIRKLIRLFLPTAPLVVGLLGCSGGGDGQVAGGGIGGTGAPVGISFGTITQKGSIFVNGVEFSTSSATPVDRDGVPVDVGTLQRGMTVEVHGSIDSSTKGTAQEVLMDEAVRGQVEFVDAANNSFMVLGQTVLVDQSTNYDQSSLPNGFLDISNLAPTDIVEVHGLVKNYGTIEATFIQRFTQAQQPALVTKYSVRGFVEKHTPDTMGGGTFQIGPALTVHYDSMTDVVAGLPANWNNLYLDIKGDSCSGGTPPACGTLHATIVDFEGFPTDQTIPNAEMEGFVRDVFPPATDRSQEFTVAGQRVLVVPGFNGFVNGMQSDMVIGVKVEVDGSLAGGILTATRIIFKDDAFESDATVTNSTLTLAGLPGITVTADSQTKFTGFASAVPSIADAGGQHVRVRGREDVGNNIIATEIELRDPGDVGKVFISGEPKSVTSPTFTILGVLVDTSMSVSDPGGFVDINDVSIGKAAFFSVLSVGDHLVKAKGTLNGSNVVIWEEVELEE